MTTDTSNNTTANVLDVDQLRAALLDLLTRANTALEHKPNAETAGEFTERLVNLSLEIDTASFHLSHAVAALRMLHTAARRVFVRHDALREVFDLDTAAGRELTSNIGDRTFWGEAQPVFPALRMDYTPLALLDEDIPF